MNDNKRLYNKLTTWFWWFIATMPIIFIIGYMLYFIFNKNYNGGFAINTIANDLYSIFQDLINGSDDLFTNLFNSLMSFFEYLGITEGSNEFGYCVVFTLSWFVFIHIIHLAIDIILLLPRICQKFIERV